MNLFQNSVNSFMRDLIYLEQARRELTREFEFFRLQKPGTMLYAISSEAIKGRAAHLASYGKLTLARLES